MAEVKRYDAADQEAIEKAKDFMGDDELTHIYDPKQSLYVPVVKMVAALFELRDDYAALERRLRVVERMYQLKLETGRSMASCELQAEREIDAEMPRKESNMMAYGPKCEELARHFLPDDAHIWLVEQLSQDLQDAAENFLATFEEKEQEG